MTSKIAIITGGSRGLGANAALKLAARNTDLIITYKQDSAAANAVVAQAIKLGAKAVALQFDAGSEVTKPDHVVRWINGQYIATLNIAGPRESKYPAERGGMTPNIRL